MFTIMCSSLLGNNVLCQIQSYQVSMISVLLMTQQKGLKNKNYFLHIMVQIKVMVKYHYISFPLSLYLSAMLNSVLHIYIAIWILFQFKNNKNTLYMICWGNVLLYKNTHIYSLMIISPRNNKIIYPFTRMYRFTMHHNFKS